MASESSSLGALRATLFEIERGLFHVIYRVEGSVPTLKDLPFLQLGADAAEAKQRVEHQARTFGFATVVWEDTSIQAFPSVHSVG